MFIETQVPGAQHSARGGIKYFILEKFLLQSPNVSAINVADVTREPRLDRRAPIDNKDVDFQTVTGSD